MKRSSRRCGYALAIVLVFMILLLSLSGMAFRHIGAALRLESVRAEQALRDQGTLPALAKALALLETGTPPSDPYQCGVTIETSSGSQSFVITYTSESTDGQWAVRSTPANAG